MQKLIVTVGEILLGVAIFFLIFGTTGSLKSEATNVFTNAIAELAKIKP